VKTNKAVATPEYIGDVMQGRRDEIPLREYPDDRLPLALWVDGNDKPTCLLEIVASWYDGEGWTVKVRAWTFEHESRLLAADSSRGYTKVPYLALTDEPEAVPDDYQDHLTMRALSRHVKRRRKDSLAAQRDRELQDLLHRVDEAMAAAKSNHMDVRDDLRAVRRMHAQGKVSAAMVLLRETERRAHRDELRDAA
jgi:hypothetical protein